MKTTKTPTQKRLSHLMKAVKKTHEKPNPKGLKKLLNRLFRVTKEATQEINNE